MLIDDIKKYDGFTTQEMNIRDYILNNPDSILDFNSNELAKASYTSPSAVIRFCKKLGFIGFADFRKAFIFNYRKTVHTNNISLKKDTSIKESVTIVTNVYDLIIEQTRYNLDITTLTRVINYVSSAKKVDFYASDINFSKAQLYCIRLNSLGINAQAFNAINKNYLRSINTSEVVSFVITHSGSNQHIIETADVLKNMGIRVIGISGGLHNKFSAHCDVNIQLYTQNDAPAHTIYYSLSLEYIFDILYANLYIRHTNENL